MPKTNGHTVETGCYAEGHRGWHAHAHVIELAEGFGFPLDDEARELVHAYDTNDHADDDHNTRLEVVLDIMDEAEAWLNDHTTAGYVWHWRDGEFFLSPMCEDEDACEDDTCAHWD